MKRTACAAAALGALALLTACGGGYHYREAAYRGPDTVWYDGYYGDYADRYWAQDGFHYRDRGGRYQHDAGGHFRQQPFEGARSFHAGSPPVHDHDPGAADRDRDLDRSGKF